jgi:hypothetical protein
MKTLQHLELIEDLASDAPTLEQLAADLAVGIAKAAGAADAILVGPFLPLADAPESPPAVTGDGAFGRHIALVFASRKSEPRLLFLSALSGTLDLTKPEDQARFWSAITDALSKKFPRVRSFASTRELFEAAGLSPNAGPSRLH